MFFLRFNSTLIPAYLGVLIINSVGTLTESGGEIKFYLKRKSPVMLGVYQSLVTLQRIEL